MQTATRISTRAHVHEGFVPSRFRASTVLIEYLFLNFAGRKDLLHLQLILCYVLQIELIEMSEPAVPAPDGKMPAPNRKIVRSGHMTVPALRLLNKLPEVIAPDFRECSRCRHILHAGDKDPGRPAVVARNLCLVGHRLDDLVCLLSAVVTASAVFREDEPVAHERYWIRPCSLTC